MTQALKEDITRRSRQWASGQDWTGYKHIRVFQGVPDGDLAAHRLAELAPGAVLPAKWGGVATARAIDPRLTNCPDVGQRGSAASMQIYTEWTEIKTISGWPTDFWTTYETCNSGSRIGTTERFQGERNCVILDSEVGTLASHYNVALGADHPFPGSTGILGAHLYGYRLAPMPERPLCSRLTLLYTDRTILQALKPGLAILMVEVEGKEVKLHYTDDDAMTPVDGPDLSSGWKKWVLVSGDNIVLKPQARVIIRTAATDANVPNIWSLIGKTNSNTFSHIGNAPAGTMQFQGAKISGTLINRKYWALDYEFKYRPLRADSSSAFGGNVKTRLFTKYALTKAVQKITDGLMVADGSKTAQVTMWHPSATTTTVKIADKTADFGWLNGQLGWY